MSIVHSIKKFIAQIRNIENWQEYSYHKKKMLDNNLILITKPYPITMRLDFDSYFVFKEIFIEDFYSIHSILNKIPNNAVVLDIGANIGFFSYLLLSKRSNAHIIAFEPFSKNVSLINKTIEANPQIKNNLTVVQKAVTNTNGETIPFYVSEDVQQTAVASIYNNFDNRNSNVVNVQTTNLQTIIAENNFQKIDVLKLDCEGAEYPILYNATDDVLQKIKLMLIEAHPLDDKENNNKTLVTFLNKKGFKTSYKKFQNNCYYTVAENLNNAN